MSPADQRAMNSTQSGSVLTGACFSFVTVFEDSIGGVQSAKLGLDILRAAGVKCNFVAKGIGVHPEKCKNLQKIGARVFPDVNMALSA